MHSSQAARYPLTDLQRAARILSAEAGPLSTKQLARQLWNYQRVPAAVAAHLRERLKAYPAFVEVAADEWELGHRGLRYLRKARIMAPR